MNDLGNIFKVWFEQKPTGFWLECTEDLYSRKQIICLVPKINDKKEQHQILDTLGNILPLTYCLSHNFCISKSTNGHIRKCTLWIFISHKPLFHLITNKSFTRIMPHKRKRHPFLSTWKLNVGKEKEAKR